MIPIFLFVEDSLSEAVAIKLLKNSKNSFGISGNISGGCDKIKKNIKQINDSARGMPFMVLVDQDREECAPTLVSKWLPIPKHSNLLFRVAVREVESWVMADIDGFSHFIGIHSRNFPFDMDSVADPKQFLLQMAEKSKRRVIRQALIPKRGSNAKVGPDYNGTLIQFVITDWNITRAVKHSDSLKRTVNAIDNLHYLPKK